MTTNAGISSLLLSNKKGKTLFSGSVHAWEFPSIALQLLCILSCDEPQLILPRDSDHSESIRYLYNHSDICLVCVKALYSVLCVGSFLQMKELSETDIKTMDLVVRNFRYHYFRLFQLDTDLEVAIEFAKSKTCGKDLNRCKNKVYKTDMSKHLPTV